MIQFFFNYIRTPFFQKQNFGFKQGASVSRKLFPMELCLEGLSYIWRSHSAQIRILFEPTKLRSCTVLAAGLCLILLGMSLIV